LEIAFDSLSASDIRIAAVGVESGFAVVSQANGEAINVRRYDLDGTHVSGPSELSLLDDADGNGVAFADASKLVAFHLQGSRFLVTAKGRYNLAVGDNNAALLLAVGENDVVVAQNSLGPGSLYFNDYAKAPNGHVLFGYELSGPDAAAYIVVDATGVALRPAEHTILEPEDLCVAAFDNGEFAFLIVDDESEAFFMQLISNTGYPIGSWNPLGTATTNQVPIAWPSGSNEVTLLFTGYGAGTRTMSIAPGYLKLEETSTTEVRVYNNGAQAAQLFSTVH
jgi:hypothetical protein